MSYTTLTNATEGSAYPVTIALTDDAGGALIPDTATWTLTDLDGNVINSRNAVSLTPASSMTLVLSGDDLDVATGYEKAERALIIEGTYTDPTFGSGLDFRQEFRLTVEALTEKIA